MPRHITLKFEATCADSRCGAILPVGAHALWYGRGRVYGRGCHTTEIPAEYEEERRQRRYAEADEARAMVNRDGGWPLHPGW